MPSPRSKSTDSYHHGNLREALITAAREALETTALEAITLKSLATQLGVSQPAPYRHFASREALLQAVAEDGFRRFHEALEAAGSAGPSQEGTERSALAYIHFGQSNRGVYRLMFASRIVHTASHDSPLARAASTAFNSLLASVSVHAPPERARAVAVWVWSTLHGIVMLDSEGLLAGPADKALSVEQVVREFAEALRLRLRP